MNNVYQLISNNRLAFPTLEKDLVNSYYNLSDFEKFNEMGATYCVFHDDKNKPSAKFYKDDDGVERLYCFVCRKQYTAYDYIKQILNKNPIQMLMSEVSEKELLEQIEDYLKNPRTIRKSKLTKDYSNMSEIEFIDYICLGE